MVITLAGEEVDGVFEHGFIMYGVPVGSDAYCRHKLMEVANGIVRDGQKTPVGRATIPVVGSSLLNLTEI